VECVIKQYINTLRSVLFINCCVCGHAGTGEGQLTNIMYMYSVFVSLINFYEIYRLIVKIRKVTSGELLTKKEAEKIYYMQKIRNTKSISQHRIEALYRRISFCMPVSKNSAAC
jgi:hypothetical protein